MGFSAIALHIEAIIIIMILFAFINFNIMHIGDKGDKDDDDKYDLIVVTTYNNKATENIIIYIK